MLKMPLSEVALVLEGQLLGQDLVIDRISTDTRNLCGGELFIALKGERFDAHDFIENAHQAAALLVSRPVDSAQPQILVKDTRLALGRLGQYIKEKVAPKSAALTGSCGKTTVKEMLAAILALKGPVLATKGNFNNDIGVPLTLLRLEPSHQYGVFELGANHEGEIAYTASLVQADVALVNNVAPTHLQGFGTLAGIARAKGEIYGPLAKNGVAVVNLDDDFAPDWLAQLKDKEVLTFGFKAGADISATDIQDSLDAGSRFTLKLKDQQLAVTMPLPGLHNVNNAMAAAACALALGVDGATIVAGLAQVQPVPGRLNIRTLGRKDRLIDDTYNASVGAVRAAIDTLSRYQGRRVLVLGDLGELGERARHYHAELGHYAKAAGIDNLFTLGVLSQAASDAFGLGAGHYDNREALVSSLVQALADEAAEVSILVKGARSSRMELVVDLIAASRLAAPQGMAC
ncbi:UDP-N-acetylmuramoyl-tripeptide--D-alanyl-D-alanine ligase [Gallaecimonas xiamenensis]|uniref:UDP-N-acetylmuramoyl-tripeptide--D-alanyl-D-alanine ligase n=1 Tax=Gallaecimonas xiamenensis 3-C-1 TaxID=745411 RepID=K2K1T1_9GAMM|nr:UDP-N-acetylmuramoyl-tripeptide--D-alanyl-D-alanine ligase [Gallaecimonas xiamenensis]EKE71455.1 D-alanine:D-alanine-adding enzyme [Gallaecimonas xiamenensis 3-C-1]